MALNPQQIQQILSVARALGMDRAELDGLEEELLFRAADLDGVQRVELYLAEIGESGAHMEGFIEASTTLGRGLLRRGASALWDVDDDEWERLVREGAPDDSQEEA